MGIHSKGSDEYISTKPSDGQQTRQVCGMHQITGISEAVNLMYAVPSSSS
jgi:hypothetical protein